MRGKFLLVAFFLNPLMSLLRVFLVHIFIYLFIFFLSFFLSPFLPFHLSSLLIIFAQTPNQSFGPPGFFVPTRPSLFPTLKSKMADGRSKTRVAKRQPYNLELWTLICYGKTRLLSCKRCLVNQLSLQATKQHVRVRKNNCKNGLFGKQDFAANCFNTKL